MGSTPATMNAVLQPLCLMVAGQPTRVPWSTFSPTDWTLFAAAARAHGVAPLLCQAFEAAGWPASMPVQLRRDLWVAYHATASRNRLLFRELDRMLAALFPEPRLRGDESPPDARGTISKLPATIVLKGAALATTLYSDIALRPLSDVDLLVPREYLQLATQGVRSLGYREAYPEMTPGLNRAAGHHVFLRGGPADRVAVELHWSLVGGDNDWRTPALDWFWQETDVWSPGAGVRTLGETRGSQLSGPARPVFQLTPTAHLLYSAAHLMLQHGGAQARLLWFYDLHLLITRWGERLEWDEILRRAREFYWAAALHAALEGLQARFGTPLPPGFLDALAEVRDSEAERLVARMGSALQTRSIGAWNHLSAMQWRTRLHLAWSIVCPSPTYMRWRYAPRPIWLWPLCYPYRWFDIVRDSLRTFVLVTRRRRAEGEGQHT